MDFRPLISIIIPHRPDREIRCIDSINSQTYKNLEVIIQFDDGKHGAAFQRNRGARRAQGEFLFFCDDDIILEPDCLEIMLKELNGQPDCSFAYCDYRKAGALEGIETMEEWCFPAATQRNFVSTMSLIRAGNFPGFDESLTRYQDWDLCIRIGKHLKGWYIPKTLFTAYFDDDSISMQGRKSRLHNTEIIKKKHGIIDKKLSIILPVYGQIPYLRKCLSSIVENTRGDYEIIIIDDNGPAEPVKNGIADLDIPNLKLIQGKKRLWHSGAINAGCEVADGDVFCLLNSDTLVPWNWNIILQYHLYKNTLDRELSAIGPITNNSASPQQKNIKITAAIDGMDVNIIQSHLRRYIKPRVYIAKITGFCMVVDRRVWQEIGPFDEDFRGGGNEADWIIRGIKEEMYPAICTETYVHHFKGRSYKSENKKAIWEEGRQLILKKHGEKWLNLLEQRYYFDLL